MHVQSDSQLLIFTIVFILGMLVNAATVETVLRNMEKNKKTFHIIHVCVKRTFYDKTCLNREKLVSLIAYKSGQGQRHKE